MKVRIEVEGGKDAWQRIEALFAELTKVASDREETWRSVVTKKAESWVLELDAPFPAPVPWGVGALKPIDVAGGMEAAGSTGGDLDPVIGTERFCALPEAEQARMDRQLKAMREYSAILGERIAAFG